MFLLMISQAMFTSSQPLDTRHWLIIWLYGFTMTLTGLFNELIEIIDDQLISLFDGSLLLNLTSLTKK